MRITRIFLVGNFLSVCVLTVAAQKIIKVKRHGVNPVNVTKPSAIASYSVKQFDGKWQEITRKDRLENTNVDFSDTFFFSFSGDSNVYSRNGSSLSFKGNAEIQPVNIIAIAGDEFTIISLDKTKAVLDDGEKYIHTMAKKKTLWYETLPTDSIKEESYDHSINVTLPAISGKWVVYRREAKPGALSQTEMLIKILDIKNEDNSQANGEVTFYHEEVSETLACNVGVHEGRLQVVTSKNSWLMDIYKADQKDLVFGNSIIKYYCRRK